VERSGEDYPHLTILCRVPFLQLVESSVELLKDVLYLVERSAVDYPHLTILCKVPFLQLVESSVELLKDGLEELVERSAEGYILTLLSCARFPSCSWLSPLWSY
jgi:hypothetical protein